MKKIAAVAIAGALTAGVTAISQPSADAYGFKPTHCAILGAGNDTSRFKAFRGYPVQFIVSAPGAVPHGIVTATFAGGGHSTYTKSFRLSDGSAFFRMPIAKTSWVRINMHYSGATGLLGCSSTQHTYVIKG